nr:hypothetical protein [Tanacetum cinerariifolium]
LYDPSAFTTPSKPDNQEQSSEQEISPTTLDVVLTLSQSKTRARAAKIIYKRLKKQQSSFGLDFTDAAILAAGRVSAGGVVPAVIVSASGADPAVVISAGGVDPTDVVVSVGGADPTDVVVSAGGVDHAVVISAGGADLTNVVVSASGADSAGIFIFAGVSVATGPSVASAPSSPIRDPAKGKAIATPSSPG